MNETSPILFLILMDKILKKQASEQDQRYNRFIPVEVCMMM